MRLVSYAAHRNPPSGTAAFDPFPTQNIPTKRKNNEWEQNMSAQEANRSQDTCQGSLGGAGSKPRRNTPPPLAPI
eukprot:1196363-Prorocentrum_minimum.AAC.1